MNWLQSKMSAPLALSHVGPPHASQGGLSSGLVDSHEDSNIEIDAQTQNGLNMALVASGG